MKQTAVEWLENEFKEAHKMFGGIDTNWIKRFEQAKAMEKEQIIKAYETAMETDIYNEPLKIGKDYYEQTFKSK
jgi:hypothetical protein